MKLKSSPSLSLLVSSPLQSTVHDLTVHRATPEELLRRHELHKSKNRTLVHLELQEKAPKRKWGKQKQMAHGSLEKRKLTLMREILSDQYQLQDVLERSDQVMAVVKDLFGDVPRRRTGFPNVTMAPNCGLDSSKGRIVQKHDPPTQLSVLSESVMDSQVTSLNASSEVKRIHSRLLNKEGEETMNPMYTVKQVLNPDSRKQKQIAAKVKRKQATQNSSRQRMGDSHANSFPLDLPRDNKSSLDVLNCMIDKVEHELEEYERCTGREVQKTRKSEGLAGFTLSLVNALCRLMCYLKESEMQLHEKDLIRQQHEEMLNEHRELIDALTAEILLVREENITIQKKLQQYMISTNEQLTSLVQSFKGFALTESERGQISTLSLSLEKSTLSYYEPRTDAGNRENILKFPHEDVPLKFPQKPSASGSVEAGGSLPTHIFQPAVLLSPPQQKSSQKSSPFQNGKLLVAISLIISPSTENTEREPCRERTSPSSLVTQSTSEEKYLFSQRQPISPAEKDLESSQEKVSLPSLGDSGKNNAIREFSQCSDLLGQIAELTQQNSFIKTQLSKFRGFSEERGDGLHQPGPIQNINSSLDTSKEQVRTQLIIPKSLEERIAELNRQSAEARDKLLQLIDQQKLGAAYMVSPLVSPIPPPSLNYTGNLRCVPKCQSQFSFLFNLILNVYRSAGSSGKPCSPLSATSESVKLSPGSQRPKVRLKNFPSEDLVTVLHK
uniref:Spindle and centriole-associated protein 1 n=1 Tax=Nothoprocta perdicaria TaxID=30464 RepID=A0A8C6ZL22_NOTPE